jgi:uncharacterized protein
VWVHPGLAVRTSAIEGHGLVATEPVPEGTVVVRLGGRLVPTDELARLLAAAAHADAPFVDTVTIDEDLHLVLPPGTRAHFGNHSCDPTLWHVGPYDLAARRDLGAGDEATVDYGTQSGAAFTMPCRCGSERCRGVVSADDWRRPELRRRYGDHWTPALRRRIGADPATGRPGPPPPGPGAG